VSFWGYVWVFAPPVLLVVISLIYYFLTSDMPYEDEI